MWLFAAIACSILSANLGCTGANQIHSSDSVNAQSIPGEAHVIGHRDSQQLGSTSWPGNQQVSLADFTIP